MQLSLISQHKIKNCVRGDASADISLHLSLHSMFAYHTLTAYVFILGSVNIIV